MKAYGVDKGRALGVAATHLGLELAAVMAIGDGPNDLPMLQVAGTAVAMGQSSDAVKRSAHLITSSIDEEGVARALTALMGPPAGRPLPS